MSLAPLSEILEIKASSVARLSYQSALRQPEQTLNSFVITKEAQGSLARLSDALGNNRPGAFWLSGPRGAGKTHFLACLTALFAGRPATVPGAFKEELPKLPALCVAIEIADSTRLAQAISEALWEKLKLPAVLSSLWRRMGTELALRATLEQVGGMGFGRIIILIDHAGEHGLDAERWRMINALAGDSHALSPIFFIVAARGEPLAGDGKLTVAASGAREVVAKTLRGIRSFISDSETAVKRYYDLYSAANYTRLSFEQFHGIFPFHERTIEVLEAIGRDCQRDEILGEIIGETLCANGSEPALLSSKRLVMPADLLRSSSARLRIRAACVDQSFETYELASIRLSRLELSPAHLRLANDLAKTLFLANFATEPGRRRLKPSDLLQLVASHLPAIDAAYISELLVSMVSELDGVIVLENGGAARYRRSDRPDSFLLRWNDGLALLRLVEPELTKAYDMVTLFDQAEKFCATLRDRRADLSDQAAHLRYLAALLGASPRALIALNAFGNLLATGNHEAFLKQATTAAGGAANLPALADDIARLQRLAHQAAKLVEIKRYLDAIPGNCEALRPIESMRLQLLADLDFQSLFARRELASSTIARFEGYKLRYHELYRAAHREHHAAVDHFARKLELAQIRFPVLARLNRVRELGHPVGVELEHDLKMLAHELMPCPESIEPALIDAPRCGACEFRFESGPPLAELDRFEEQLAKALAEKLRALSSADWIRILTQADSQQRLGEVLELLRQEVFDQLAATIDEDTAGYIVGLLIKARS